MVLVVLPALIPDIRRIYDVYFAAFEHDTLGRLMLNILFPTALDPAFRDAHAAGTLQWWHSSDNQYTLKCVDGHTGDIVGMGLGDLYLRERTPAERPRPAVPWLQGAERARAERILNPLWEMREELFGGRPYICEFLWRPRPWPVEEAFVVLKAGTNTPLPRADCHVIAVDPKHQGRKAGAQLVQWGIDMGEQTGLPVYFESSPSTVRLYEKMGFEVLPRHRIVHRVADLGSEDDIEVPLMVRMPSSAGGMTFDEWRRQGEGQGQGHGQANTPSGSAPDAVPPPGILA